MVISSRRNLVRLTVLAAAAGPVCLSNGTFAAAVTAPVAPSRLRPLATTPVAGPPDAPGQLVCGNAAGLFAGLWQTGPDRVDGFLWQAGRIRHLPGSSHPLAMNRSGIAVGEIADQHTHQAFRWSNGRQAALPYLGGTDTLGGYLSSAVGVTSSGLIVGRSTTDSGEQHACLWAGSVSQDLGTLGGSESSAAAVNDLGQVVGTSLTSTGDSHGFVWSNQRIDDLGTLGGTWSSAIGVNNAGLVVGSSGTSDGRAHAFCWQNGRMTDLGALDGDEGSEAVAVNGRGQVLVRSYGTRVRAFLWADGRRTEIRGFGDGGVDPAGLNGSGVVCGTVDVPGGDGHAFRWQQGVLTDLGTLGGARSSASHVTATGVVLGDATDAAGPVPHPAFWAP